MQVDCAGMHPLHGRAAFDLLQRAVVVGFVQNGEAAAAGRAQVDLLSRVAGTGEGPAVALERQPALLLKLHHSLHEAGAEKLLVVETARTGHVTQRRFVRSAGQMPQQDGDVVRVDKGVLVRPAKQLGRVAHIVLIQRVAERDQHGQ